MRIGCIQIRCKAPLRGVAGSQKVLPVRIRQKYHLIALIEGVHTREGVLLPHIKTQQIVLPLIVIGIPKQPPAHIAELEAEVERLEYDR